MNTLHTVFFLLAGAALCSAHNILDYGAIPNNVSLAAAQANGYAIYQAIQAANSDPIDRVAHIPSLPDGMNFTMVPYDQYFGLDNVTIVLDGVLNLYPGPTENWPNVSVGQEGAPGPLDVIAIFNSNEVTLTSWTQNGTIFGNGYHWWWKEIFTGIKHLRPNLLKFQSCTYTVMEHIRLMDSPRYHVKWVDMLHGLIQFIDIHVSVDDQKSLLRQGGRLTDGGLPTFPLNTDGIDVRGHNITVRRCHVENFDDSLCAKPMNQGGNLTQCTTDLVFEDSTITNGVGASIGSVPPNRAVNCIRNVTFRRISFDHPLKAIYVKPNPCPNGAAVDGTGIIDNILYEDIYAISPLWWSIWVSTQQQHQPGGNANTGCSFLFPIPGHKCPTQPCVPVTNLKLRNVYMEDALLSAGILRCNEGGPCTGWEWNNVTIKSRSNWPVGNAFLCQAIENSTFTQSSPGCVYNMSSVGDSELRHFELGRN